MDKPILHLEKPIAFYPQLAKALGGIEEAIFIQQLYYWSDKSKNKEGWIYKSKKEWEDETTLTKYQQDRIVKKLKNKKIIEVKLKGVPATLHYKLNIQMLQKAITRCWETRQLDIGKVDNSYMVTENTTENTHYGEPSSPGLSSKKEKKDSNTTPSSSQEVFNSDEWINNAKTDKKRHIRISAWYMIEKEMSFPTKTAAQTYLRRLVSPAKALTEYSNEQIMETADWLNKQKWIKDWTLETILKYIAKPKD